MTNQWCRIMTNNGWRVFPISIQEAYLKQVSSGRAVPEPVDRASIDMPGMIMTDRTYQMIELDGIDIEMPSQDFPILHEQLKRAKEEFLPGGISIFKLRGWVTGMVLTLELRNKLLQKMSELLPSVKLIAQKEDEEFTRRIESVNRESPVKVISARAEITKQKKDEDKEKPS